jgi:hypothetical protein
MKSGFLRRGRSKPFHIFMMRHRNEGCDAVLTKGAHSANKETMMRSIAIAAVLAMAALPAAAQQSGTVPQTSPSSKAESSKAAGQPSAAAQAKLRQSLEQAGFKDIKVLDAAYLVHARTGDGDMAVMYIDPPVASSATTGTSASGSDKQSMAMTQSKVRQSLEKAGFKDVKIVDATYLVNAQTSDGSKVIMHVNPPSTASSSSQMAPGGSSGATQQSK